MSNSISFGTDGWRAIIADSFTFANVERVAYAVGLYVKQAYQPSAALPVLISYDTRFLADKFAERAARVLISMGIPVKYASRDVPTPVIAYAAQFEPTAGVMQFTASHNPPEYCGVKYIPDYAGPATVSITNQIVGYLKDLPQDYQVPDAPVPRFDPKPPYMAALQKLIDFKRIGASGLSIAYDALYSTSRDYLDEALLNSGLKLTVLHNWRDPLFGGGMPEPRAEFLQELTRLVVEQKLDAGIATDGDGDRFGVIDEQGNFISPNQLMALLTRHLVKNRHQKGAIVRTVATSHLLDRLAEMYGLELIETPVGFKYIGEVMRHKDVLIGGEESGGISVAGHVPEKDGILANLLVIEMMAYEGKPLSVIWEDLNKEAGIRFFNRRKDLHLSQSMQSALMERLQQKPFENIGPHKVVRVGRQDGLKFYIDDHNWLLMRPSGTEPMFRLYFEASSDQAADKMVADFQVQVDEVLRTLEDKPMAKVK